MGQDQLIVRQKLNVSILYAREPDREAEDNREPKSRTERRVEI